MTEAVDHWALLRDSGGAGGRQVRHGYPHPGESLFGMSPPQGVIVWDVPALQTDLLSKVTRTNIPAGHGASLSCALEHEMKGSASECS